MYGIAALLGAAALCGEALFLARIRGKIAAEDIFYMLLYAGIGCLAGAKLLYLITSVDRYWFFDKGVRYNLKYWFFLLTSGGLVFYGGLAGAFLGAVRYCVHFKIPLYTAIETVIPAVPLFHCFGRIGCFMAGCCYGIEYDGVLSVTFNNAAAAPNGVALFPIQLFEAAGNFVICILLTVIFLKNIPRLSLSGLYLICYGVMRFILEFFRGDDIRGGMLCLSASQWISISVIAAGCVIEVKAARIKQ